MTRTLAVCMLLYCVAASDLQLGSKGPKGPLYILLRALKGLLTQGPLRALPYYGPQAIGPYGPKCPMGPKGLMGVKGGICPLSCWCLPGPAVTMTPISGLIHGHSIGVQAVSILVVRSMQHTPGHGYSSKCRLP